MADRKLRPGDQQLPVVNDRPAVQDAVIEDLRERTRVGVERYGTPLQPFNGRSALRDAYEEALDLACYLKQRLLEEQELADDAAIAAEVAARDATDTGERLTIEQLVARVDERARAVAEANMRVASAVRRQMQARPPASVDTTLVYVDDALLLHLSGPNPGTPYTVCGIDAGNLRREERPVTWAGVWCAECLRLATNGRKGDA